MPLKWVMRGAVDFLRDEFDEFFAELHQVVVVGVGLVELEHGELGVVFGADALVAEVAVDLVDAVEAADDQSLQIQLGRDAQEEIEVERVVMRGEGLRGCASGDLVHHRGFDFEVAAAVEEFADGAEDGGAFDEDLADVGGFGFGRWGSVAESGTAVVAGRALSGSFDSGLRPSLRMTEFLTVGAASLLLGAGWCWWRLWLRRCS